MKTTDFLREFTDAPSDGTDATMAKNTLHTIVRVASQMEHALSDNEHLPEWVEEKLGAIREMMVTVMDYALSQHEMDQEHEDGLPVFNIGDAERTMSEMVADEGIEESDLYSPKSHVEEGQGDFEKALARFDGEGNIGGWQPETESNYEFGKYQPMVDQALEQGAKIYDYDDNEGGYYYHGEIIASPDGMFYSNINNEIAAHKGMGEMMRAIRKAFDVDSYHGMGEPGPTNFDKLNSRRATTPDDLYKTNKLGRKGTLTTSRGAAMKSPYRGGLGGPKGVLPEQGVAEGETESIEPYIIDMVKKLTTYGPVDRYSAYRNIASALRKTNPKLAKQTSELAMRYMEADMSRSSYNTAKTKAMYDAIEPDHQAFIKQVKQVLGQGVAEDQLNELDMFAPVTTFIKMTDGSYVQADWRRGQYNAGFSDSASFINFKPVNPTVAKQLGLDSHQRNNSISNHRDGTIASGGNYQGSGPMSSRRYEVVDYNKPETMEELPDEIKPELIKWVQKQGVAEAKFGKEWDEELVATYTVYVSDGTTWHREGGVYDHEMAAQRYIHQQVFTKNPQARVGILGPGDAKPVVVPPIKGHTYKESVKGAMGLKEMASLRQQLKQELNRLSEDSGATVSSLVATVVTKLGAGGMTRKQVESKLKGYTNRQSNVKHDIKPPKAKK